MRVISELALSALMAAALLNSVHVRPTAQRTNPPTAEADAVVRQVLADRIAAKDIPDFGLLRGAKRVAVRSDGVGLGLALGKDALPALEGYELRLISTTEAQAEAERTQAVVHFIAIDHLQIGEDTAVLWIGVDLTMPTDPKMIKMCCCSRSLEYRRVEDRWVFVRWGNEGRCS
jgi:hypothetical protein